MIYNAYIIDKIGYDLLESREMAEGSGSEGRGRKASVKDK